jgi:ATP-dependent Clp protease adaptor protein ClpS
MGRMQQTATLPRTRTTTRTERPWLWNVVLLDDDHHTYEYVVDMMSRVFGHPAERGFQIARRVDSDGRAVCLTTHRELAELKIDQVTGFGRDVRMSESVGSMTAILEPAEAGGEDD